MYTLGVMRDRNIELITNNSLQSILFVSSTGRQLLHLIFAVLNTQGVICYGVGRVTFPFLFRRGLNPKDRHLRNIVHFLNDL